MLRLTEYSDVRETLEEHVEVTLIEDRFFSLNVNRVELLIDALPEEIEDDYSEVDIETQGQFLVATLDHTDRQRRGTKAVYLLDVA